jgi:N-(2-amino-2-carboxyethyl)-L-glutamate synthase
MVGLSEPLLSSIFAPTPMCPLAFGTHHVLAKLESVNPAGSHKSRAAAAVVQRLRSEGMLRPGKTKLLVSSSGNFARAICTLTASDGITVNIVTDVLSSPRSRQILSAMPNARLYVVDDADGTGSHTAARLGAVRRLLQDSDMLYVDQTTDPTFPASYEESLALEIWKQTGGQAANIFVPVGTGATILGICRFGKRHAPSWRVFAVDACASGLFWTPNEERRRLPGFGNSRPTPFSEEVRDNLTHIIHVPDIRTVITCRQLLRKHSLFVGASSGAVAAAFLYVADRAPERLSAAACHVLIFPDGGEQYVDSVYNDRWVAELLRHPRGTLASLGGSQGGNPLNPTHLVSARL